MDAELLLRAMVAYATRVAFRMSKDPEMESIANAAAFRAARTYDGIHPLKHWVAVVTRRAVWHHWRKLRRRHETLVPTEWLERTVVAPDPDLTELHVSVEDWQFLYDRFVLKWPLDVMARRHGNDCSIRRIRAMIAEKTAHFLDAYRE